jgi:phosphonopyruvate decarboxylase
MTTRYEYLEAIVPLAGDALVVATGGTIREWSALRPSDGNFKPRTLGLVSSIALGVALGLPHRKVLALDGDGAFLMNLCGLPTIAWQNPPNLIHLLFDNQCHEAAGGGVTATSTVADPVALAKAAGYPHACWARNLEELRQEFAAAWKRNELSLIAAKVDVGRPKKLPPLPYDEIENKYRFMRHIEAAEKRPIVEPPR